MVQLPLGVQLRETATLAGFVAGPNAEAVAAASGVARGEYDSVYLWGGPGAGKSHLLQAVCRSGTDAGRRAAYVPLAQFVGQSSSVLDGLDTLDLICLDELQAIAGEAGWEQALVGLFDRARRAGAGLLAAGRSPPGELGLALADLSSRLGWGPVYGLRDLCDADKRRLLQRRAGERGLRMPDEVATFLLRRSARDPASLLALLDRLDDASLAAKRPLTVPFVKQVLAG